MDWLDVTALCGHVVKLPLFKKDPYREQRQAKVTQKICRECNDKNLKEQQLQGQLNRKRKNQKRWQADRLPDCSHFSVTYNDEKKMWKGTLSIIGPNETFKTFEGEKSGVFRLLQLLDKQYRQWEQRLKENSSSVIPTDRVE
jgi:hypothetical protein